MPDKINFPVSITAPLDCIITSTKEALYAVFLTARCHGSQDDLRVEFDGRSFREVPPVEKPSLFNVPVAWNGSLLKGQSQTIILILWLAPVKYTLKFIPRGTAEITESPRLIELANPRDIKLMLNQQAADADGRPWHAIALVDLPLVSCGADVSVGWHWRDGDDTKLIIDAVVERNPNNYFHRDWLWSARPWHRFYSLRETKTINRILPRGVHYLEFWADCAPTLHAVALDLGDGKRLPTREAPRWTGNFVDDSDELLMARVIYGEMGSEPFAAKLGVAWVIRNRVTNVSGNQQKTYRGVMLADSQFSVFKDSRFGDVEEEKSILMINPPLDIPAERNAWYDSVRAMEGARSGQSPDPTRGATNFYSIKPADPAWRPFWADEKKFIVQFGRTRFFKL